MTEDYFPPLVQLPQLPPPSHYGDFSYQDEWRKLAEDASNINQVVTHLAWHDDYLFACSVLGDIIIWQVGIQGEDSIEKAEDDEGKPSIESKIKKRQPRIKVQISTGSLSSIQIRSHQGRNLLFVSGDEGIWCYELQNWLTHLTTRDPSAAPTVLAHFHPHPSVRGTPINNFDVYQNFLYGAAHDAFGCYKWDMETQRITATFATKRNGHVHTVKSLSDGNVLMGGDDGSLGVWNGIQDGLVEHLDVKSTIQQMNSLASGHALKQRWNAKTRLHISHIDSGGESWWNVCGGAESPQSGFLTTWYGPTRSLMAACVTRETPKRIAHAADSLLTVADEGVVSHWNPMQLRRTRRLWCSPPCSYAIAVRTQDSCTAVAGVGTQVDIYRNLSDRVFSLTLNDPRHLH